MQTFKIKVKPQIDRLDLYLVSKTKEISRSKIQRFIKEGQVRVNGEAATSNYKIASGDLITLELPSPKAVQIKAEKLSLKVIYEDDDLIVIDKPAGVVVHPTNDHTSGTVVNWLLDHLKGFDKDFTEDSRPGVVHRLDKGTSGLLVIAKNPPAAEKLKKQFSRRMVKKKYLALVSGELVKPFGTIKGKIGRDSRSFQKFAVREDGKEAETEYRLFQRYPGASLLEVYPRTGRTHQIRVHLSSIGKPIVGDKLYGGKTALNRPFLHAAALSFLHPTTGKPLNFESPLPPALQAYLDKLSLK